MLCVFVLGCVCLFGEYLDWVGVCVVCDGLGVCVVVGMCEGVSVWCDVGEGLWFCVVGVDGDVFECDVSVDDVFE